MTAVLRRVSVVAAVPLPAAPGASSRSGEPALEAAWADRLERGDARLDEPKAVLQSLTARLQP